jgi:hypothetical protein
MNTNDWSKYETDMQVTVCTKRDAPKAQIMNLDFGAKSPGFCSICPTNENPLARMAMKSNNKGSPPMTPI